MNFHQQHSSHEDTQAQNTESVWAVSALIDHITNESLTSYLCEVPEWVNIIWFKTEKTRIICLASDINENIQYALCKKPNWTTRLLNTIELRKLNNYKSTTDISSQFKLFNIPNSNKSWINKSINKQKNKFSDGKYTYTSNRWQKFDVTIERNQAIEIKPHGSILLWSNVWAIKRCITLWFDKNFTKYWELENKKNNEIEIYTNQVSNNIFSIHDKTAYHEPNILEKETATPHEIENTVVHTVYQCEKLLTDDLNQYSRLLKTINHKLFSYTHYNDLNNEILEQLCIWLFIFSKKTWFTINQLKEILDDTILYQNYRVDLLKNIEINDFSTEFVQDILSFLNKAEQIIKDTESIKNPSYDFSDIWDDIITGGFEEKKYQEGISKQDAWNMAMQWHRNNQKAKEYREKY